MLPNTFLNRADERGSFLQAKRSLYYTLFISTFSLSAFTFGGGYVIVPLMKKKFVETLGWIDEEEMLNMIALAQSSPGPIAVNTSFLIGYKMAGIPGALITVAGTVLPPLIIISIISLFYSAFRDNQVVNAVLKGMQAGVAAVIADVVLGMGSKVVAERKASSFLIMAGAFIATYLLKINVALIVLSCAVLGVVKTLWRKPGREQK